MLRVLVSVFAVLTILSVGASADVASDDLAVGINFGMLQPTGGEESYEESGMVLGLMARKPLTDRIWMSFEYAHGVSANSEAIPAGRLQGFGDADEFRTVWNKAQASAVYNLIPEGRVIPFLSAGLGMTFWEVQDWREDAAEEGEIAEGYNDDGKKKMLRATDFTAVVGAGADIFVTEAIALTVGARYSFLLGNNIDNVGLSSVAGADWVDANNAIVEAYAGLSFYFGPGDCDGDGIIGRRDKCWDVPEDFDGFEDEDGCPEPDNDMDGILDKDDACPDDPEDFDGDADEDGCPDIDMDGDGILDGDDACPEDPEDFDGFEDGDGCPDFDNDSDGVLDSIDTCPDTPPGVTVDDRGCEIVLPATAAADIYPVGVRFSLNSAVIPSEGQADLDRIVLILTNHPELVAQIDGFTCDLGEADYNMTLSGKRATAVIEYFTEHGIAIERFSKKAFGEGRPAFANVDEESRSRNRRVVITPKRVDE
jgi:outer membrane protein OmpA-like peptidoglycan-associated protein/opacity protein-like surface antigen